MIWYRYLIWKSLVFTGCPLTVYNEVIIYPYIHSVGLGLVALLCHGFLCLSHCSQSCDFWYLIEHLFDLFILFMKLPWLVLVFFLSFWSFETAFSILPNYLYFKSQVGSKNIRKIILCSLYKTKSVSGRMMS